MFLNSNRFSVNSNPLIFSPLIRNQWLPYSQHLIFYFERSVGFISDWKHKPSQSLFMASAWEELPKTTTSSSNYCVQSSSRRQMRSLFAFSPVYLLSPALWPPAHTFITGCFWDHMWALPNTEQRAACQWFMHSNQGCPVRVLHVISGFLYKNWPLTGRMKVDLM